MDSEPPHVVAAFPDSNAVRVAADHISIEFNEYVDRRSLEESIFISPFLGSPEFSWSGTEVEMRFPDTLRPSTTYVLNIGTDVRDVRARNRMASAYTLAFSTGDSIDRGFLEGRVWDDRPEGVMIFAYRLAGADTLNPSLRKPDYITQTGEGGRFRLSHIAPGTYRLIAVRDEYKDLLYNRQMDGVGVLPGDPAAGGEEPAGRKWNFRIAVEDTAGPFVTSAEEAGPGRIILRFSEPLDTASLAGAAFRVTDSSSGADTGPWTGSLSLWHPAGADLGGGILDTGRVYRVSARGLKDRSGNPVDTLHDSALLTGASVRDTVRPMFRIPGLADSSDGWPPARRVLVSFSEPVRHEEAERALRVTDTEERSLILRTEWLTASDLAVGFREEPPGGAWHRLRVDSTLVRDASGNRAGDSTRVIRFRILDARSTGSIEGTVLDERESAAGGDLIISIRRVGAQADPVILRTPHGGRFRADRLPEGRYVLDVFRDEDGSGAFTRGNPFPWAPSERFAVLPDTLRVRARWAVEGVLLRLP